MRGRAVRPALVPGSSHGHVAASEILERAEGQRKRQRDPAAARAFRIAEAQSFERSPVEAGALVLAHDFDVIARAPEPDRDLALGESRILRARRQYALKCSLAHQAGLL